MNINAYSVLAAIQFLVPGSVIQTCQRFAFTNPEAARLRRGVVTVARFEGMAFLWAFLRGESVSKPFRGVLGGIGLPMALFPGRALDVALRVGYSNADAIEVRTWVRGATRVLGIAYLLVALGVLPRDGQD